MKKILITLLVISYYLLVVNDVHSASPTSSPNVESQIGDLKERIASRVAQLKLVEKRGIIGEVNEVSNTQITLSDLKGDTRFVDVDELTRFESDSDEDFGISDIKKGQTLGVLGLYNKQSRRILARVVSQVSLPKFIHGAVETLDLENFTLIVVSEENKVITVDVETISKTQVYDSDLKEFVRSGFSKIKIGENVIIIGTPDKKEKNRIAAEKILRFPDIPKNPKINLQTNVPVVPSTGSGKKLTPITR